MGTPAAREQGPTGQGGSGGDGHPRDSLIQTSTRGHPAVGGSSASLSLASSCENRKEGRASSGCSGSELRSHACNGPPFLQCLAQETRVHVCSARVSVNPVTQTILLPRGRPSLPQGNTDLECRLFATEPFQGGLLDSNVSFLQHSIFSLLSSFYIQKTHFAVIEDQIGTSYRKHRHLLYVKSRNTCNLTLQ